jgi:Staygreen protein
MLDIGGLNVGKKVPTFETNKLHVSFMVGATENGCEIPRYYTLTHSDVTGDLFLSIGNCYDSKCISKRYTRFMRDEVLAELRKGNETLSLTLHYHVSGGFVFGNASLRNRILRRFVSYNIREIIYGDRAFFEKKPEFSQIPIFVSFHSKNKKYEKTENSGTVGQYQHGLK